MKVLCAEGRLGFWGSCWGWGCCWLLWQEQSARSLKLIYTHFRTFMCRDMLPDWMMSPDVTLKIEQSSKQCTRRALAYWWSTVAHLVHLDRRTRSCWSWRSRGECSHRCWPHRGWCLIQRQQREHSFGFLLTGSLYQVRMLTFRISLPPVIMLYWWTITLPELLRHVLMHLETNSN